MDDITGLPSDLTGDSIHDRYRRLYTKRLIGVDDQGIDVELPVDIKDVELHFEGTQEICRFTGTAEGSEEILFTSDGHEKAWPLVKQPDAAIIRGLKAPAGTTMNVSITAGQ